jgi:hypothetical protein
VTCSTPERFTVAVAPRQAIGPRRDPVRWTLPGLHYGMRVVPDIGGAPYVALLAYPAGNLRPSAPVWLRHRCARERHRRKDLSDSNCVVPAPGESRYRASNAFSNQTPSYPWR